MSDFAVWWSELDPEIKATIRDGVTVAAGLVVGYGMGGVAKRLLVAKGIDRYLRLPWTSPSIPQAAPGPRGQTQRAEAGMLSVAVAWLVTATVWAATAWGIAWLHGSRPDAQTIQSLVSRTWQAAAVVLAALLASGWLARVVYDVFHTPWLKRELDSLFADRTDTEGSFSETAARAVCAVIYAAFLLVIPVAVAGLFNLASLSGLVGPAWQVCARLLTALAAFAVGYLGLAWVRSQTRTASANGKDHSDIEYFVGLAIMVVTILLALGLLVGAASGAGTAAMIVLLAFVAYLLWPLRTHIRDLWAGLLLRLQGVKDIQVDGSPAVIQTVGPVMTSLTREGQELSRRNSEVLAQMMKASGKRT